MTEGLMDPGARVVAITGAASGIGAALARRMAVPGVALVLHTGSNREGLEAVAGAARVAEAEVGRSWATWPSRDRPRR